MPSRTSRAAVNASRSPSAPVRVFGSDATFISSDAPVADASAAADPPPGVGAEELNAARRSRSERSIRAMISKRWRRRKSEEAESTEDTDLTQRHRDAEY